MIDYQLIGKRIKELRQEKGLTQSDFASVLMVSSQAVSNWERGIAPPELANLVRIASYFGVLVDDLLCPENGGLYLGVDCGGTKTEFVLVSSSGAVLKRIVKNGANPNDIGFSGMEEIIFGGIREICMEYPSVKSAFLGIAGISAGNYLERLHKELKNRYTHMDIQIGSDAFNLFAMDDEADMAVISGTGSAVFVHSGEGYKRLGGWGYLLDSAGSAYDIGRDAIRQALKEEERLEKPSVMSNMLRSELNTDTIWNRLHIIHTEGKPYIAGLATVVFKAYAAGDKNAAGIIDNTAKALAELLNIGVELYGANPVAIASGGCFEHNRDIMITGINKYSNVKLKMIDLPPVYGACRKACIMNEGSAPEGFYDNFKRSYGGRKQ